CGGEVQRDDSVAVAHESSGGREGGFVFHLVARRVAGRAERRQGVVGGVIDGALDRSSEVVGKIDATPGGGFVVPGAQDGDRFLTELGGGAAADVHRSAPVRGFVNCQTRRAAAGFAAHASSRRTDWQSVSSWAEETDCQSVLLLRPAPAPDASPE